MVGPQRCCAAIVLALTLIANVVKAWSPLSQPFDCKTMRSTSSGTPTQLYGVLSRSAILKHKSKKQGPQHSGDKVLDKIKQQPITRTFLMDAMEEAIYRQTTALECLELERCKLVEKLRLVESTQQRNSNLLEPTNEGNMDDNGVGGGGNDLETKKKERNPRIALDRVATRKLELRERITKVEELRHELMCVGGNSQSNSTQHNSSLSVAAAESRFRTIMGSKGKPCSILDRPKDTWKIIVERSSTTGEFGRPKEFTGLVFHSPLGVPILVGKSKAESDGILRRASQGSDLWFQVEDYEGSRVLLRSSLVRGTKNSKMCIQMAADLAAYYSVWGRDQYHNNNDYCFDTVPVMYTDSKHVAKRGTKVGRMRKRKSLGRLMGRPSSVESIARELEP
jgi:hypothetical protein